MPVLITGASGFLGGRLAQMLCEQGEEVVILARTTSRLQHLHGFPVTILRGDLSGAAALVHAVHPMTHIFHCAACSTDWAPANTYRQTNVTGTRNLLTAALRAPQLQRFMHVSTTDVYGYPETPCAEDHAITDAGLPYNQTKGQAELAVWQAHREHGLPVTVVRPATIYGPRGKDFTQEIASLLRLRLMAFIDGGRALGGFTYVDSVAQAMIDASRRRSTLGEAYNLADGTQATWQEYVGQLAAQLGTPQPRLQLSFGTAMKLARGLEAMHRALRLRARPLLTRHATLLLARNQEFPIAKAESHFSFAPVVSLEEGIQRSVAWLRDADAQKR